jgi:hypothetical protein
MHELLPEKWAKDKLSEYLDLSMSNGITTFANLEKEYNSIKEIDEVFCLVSDSLNNPNKICPAILFYRSHSSFRTAIYLIMAGHQIESFAIMRQALEYALYANHMVKKPESVKVWLDRSQSKNKESKCRSEFGYGNVVKSVKIQKLNAIVKELYNRCIDNGAHPNVDSVFNSILIERKGNGKVHLQQAYLTCERPIVKLTMKTVKQTGVCMLDLYRGIWKERFQIVGIDEMLDKHKSEL